MAGIKVTDLPVLGASAPDDVMYIVDTSTNSSKQIAVSDFGVSGTFTPVSSNEVNCTVGFNGGIYSRVGNIVTLSFSFDVTLDAGETSGSFNFTLPIGTTFSSRYQCIGSANLNTQNSDYVTSCVIEADTTNTTLAKITLSCENAAESLDPCGVVLQYQVI